MELKKEIKALESEVIQIRRHFHTNPELSTQEFKTSEFVENYLHELGIETKRMYNTGVVGLIKGGKPGKTILLRARLWA